MSNATEDAGPNGGDGNGDGTPDSEQGNITSLPAATGLGYITVEVPAGDGGCSQLQNVHAETEAMLGTDPEHDYPYGLVGFTLDCATSADVTLLLHTPISQPLTTYGKFGPTPPSFDNPHFYTLPGATFGTAQIPAGTGPTVTTVACTLTNGELGDDTPASDGMIVEPGGPALATSANAPVTSRWGLIVLVLLLAGVAAAGVRRTVSRG